MIAELDHVGLRIISALGNGIYQGLLLTVCVLVALRLFRRASAATRYAVEFLTLLTVAFLPVAHFFLDARPGANPVSPASPPPSVTDEPSFMSPTLAPLDDTTPAVIPRPLRFAWTPTLPANPEDPSRSLDSVSSNAETVLRDSPVAPHSAESVEPIQSVAPVESAGSAIASTWSARITELQARFRRSVHLEVPTAVAIGALAIWMLCALVRLGLLVGQCVGLQRLKTNRQPAADALLNLFSRLRSQLGIRRNVTLGIASGLRSPVAIGFFHPAVLVPDTLAHSGDGELESMIRHELAHVQRHDDWTNLAQQAIKALLFLHPAVILLSRRMTLDREIACDDHVLANTRKPRAYALFLTDFASRTRGRQWAAAPAAWSNPSQLRERIQMILDSKRNASPRIAPTRVGLLTLTALFIAATGLYAAPRLALDPADPSPDVAELAVDATVKGTATVNVDTTVDVDGEVNTLVSTDVRLDSDPFDELTPSKPKPPRHSSATRTTGSAFSSRASSRSASPASLEIVAPSGALAIISAPHPMPAPAPHAIVAPLKPKAPVFATAAASVDHPSIEDRMRRLEQLVESLARQQGVKVPENPVNKSFEHSLNWNIQGVTKDLAKEINREVERATREAQRAIREAQKAADMNREEARATLAPMAKERKPLDASLRQQREILRRQIAQMERQLEGLENELERMEERFEESEALSDEATELEREVKLHRKHIEKETKQMEKSRESHPKVKNPNAPPAPDAPPAPELQTH